MTSQNSGGGLWLRRYHAAPQAGVQLVCFPHAGGSASYFFPVSAALTPEVNVVAVQYPGRQDRRREPCVDDLGELADRVYDEMKAEAAPIAFFGHSMGAALAFEVTRRMEADGARGPLALIASARRAPGTHREENVHLRNDAGVVAEMRLLGGSDSRLLNDPELLDMVLPAVRGDYRAIERHRCPASATVTVPITVLVGESDPRTSFAEAQAWRDHTTGPFDLHVYPGGHFFLEQHIPAILDLISRTLRRHA